MIDNSDNMTPSQILKRSMIRHHKQRGFIIRCISTVDIFSFIPIPKSRPVSTKCSLIGTVIFFAIFLGYVIYDLVFFITSNPPIPNSYSERLDDGRYSSPRFSMVYMKGEDLNETIDPSNIFNYTLQQNIKQQKISNNTRSGFVPCDAEEISWMGSNTFYNYNQYLKCPKKDVQLFLGGLLYVSDYSYNPSIKILQCYYPDQQDQNADNWCTSREQMQIQQAQGRIFLFIEVLKGSQFNKYQNKTESYRLFNFFLVQGIYNRINIEFQVNKQIILPDYLKRWKNIQNSWIQILSVSQMNSDLTPLNKTDSKARLLSIDFTLNPSIKVTKIAYLTIIDHIAQWGALWGVLFAIFALIFMSYNSKKYYKSNPDWEKYDQVDNFGVNTFKA